MNFGRGIKNFYQNIGSGFFQIHLAYFYFISMYCQIVFILRIKFSFLYLKLFWIDLMVKCFLNMVCLIILFLNLFFKKFVNFTLKTVNIFV